MCLLQSALVILLVHTEELHFGLFNSIGPTLISTGPSLTPEILPLIPALFIWHLPPSASPSTRAPCSSCAENHAFGRFTAPRTGSGLNTDTWEL